MIIKPFEELSKEFKTASVKEYYDILCGRKCSIVVKRVLDILFSVVFIIIFSPLFVVLSIAVAIDSGFPIFYKQERVTKYGKIFKVLKFRTMINGADKIGSLVTVKNDNRVTKIGSFLRKYRLDELPQIFNVFLGDMSIVGTRPEVKKYVDKYSDEMFATLLLPAGVTSKASICYKDEAQLLEKSENTDETYVKVILPKKMEYNLEYLRNFSVGRDIGIIFETIRAVFK